MSLPPFDPGRTIVIEERWRGQLWSAVPSRVVRSAADILVSWQPVGAVSVVATNRGMPEAEGLSRSDRKLLAMETLVAQAVEFEEAPEKLYIHRQDRWARVNLGWDSDDRRFLGWYVNFVQPPMPTAHGVASKDLVLDLYVNADRSWSWKDRDDFELAVERGVLGAELRSVLQVEADRIVEEAENHVGPFSDEWVGFTPDRGWAAPSLPAGYGWGGDLWGLPSGRRVVGG